MNKLSRGKARERMSGFEGSPSDWKRRVRTFWKLTVVQAKLFAREPIAFSFAIVFPAVLIDLFGIMFGNEPDLARAPSTGFVDAAAPAVASILIGTLALMTIPVNTAGARERRILRRFQASPMHPALYLTADVLVHFVMALVGMIILFINARVFFDLRLYGSWLNVLAAFSLSALSFFLMGYLIASLAATARVAQAAGMALFLPMMLLSGATLPRAMMPETLRRLSDILPMTQMVKLLQGLWFGEPWRNHLAETYVLIGILVASLTLSTLTFRWE